MNEAQKAISEANKLRAPYSRDDMKQIRASFGLSQAEFARFLGVGKSWVFKREQGATGMSSLDNAYIELLLKVRSVAPHLITEKMLNC